jgi:SOS response regulatory protein OraA/RecX
LEKGIDCNIIDDVLSEYDIDDTQIAEDILIERFGSINSAFGGVNIKKVEALLRYRGFSFRVIRELIEKTGVEAWEEIQD